MKETLKEIFQHEEMFTHEWECKKRRNKKFAKKQ